MLIPALGGMWLLRGGRRAEVGAALVAAIGVLLTAAVPGTLVAVAKLPAEWQLPAMAAPVVVALAGGRPTASLISSSSLRWSSPLPLAPLRHGASSWPLR